MAKVPSSRTRSARTGSSYIPGRPYRGDPRAQRVGTIPRGRAEAEGGHHPGEYQSPPNGPGPGRPPWGWRQSAPSDSVVDFRGGGWVQCDPSSHLQEIRFVYGLDSIRVESDLLGMNGLRFVRDQAMSVLQVRFRDGNWSVYWSVPGDSKYSADRLESIYLQMESDTSPGTILWWALAGVGGSEQWPYDSSAR